MLKSAHKTAPLAIVHSREHSLWHVCVFKARVRAGAGGPLWKDLFTCPFGLQFQEDKGEGGFPSRPAAFYLKAIWGQPLTPTPESQGWPWVPLAGLPSPAAAPGDKPRPLPPENKRDIQPPPAAARERPPGKLGVESAAIAFKSGPPAVRGALGTWLRAPSGMPQ